MGFSQFDMVVRLIEKVLYIFEPLVESINYKNIENLYTLLCNKKWTEYAIIKS